MPPPDPGDVLSPEKCLQALAALRHAKWFQVSGGQAPRRGQGQTWVGWLCVLAPRSPYDRGHFLADWVGSLKGVTTALAPLVGTRA